MGYLRIAWNHMDHMIWLVLTALKTKISVEKESVTILVLLEIVIDHHMKWIWIPKENLGLQWNATIVMSGKKKWQKHIIQTRTGTNHPIIGSLEKLFILEKTTIEVEIFWCPILIPILPTRQTILACWTVHDLENFIPYCASNCHVTAFSHVTINVTCHAFTIIKCLLLFRNLKYFIFATNQTADQQNNRIDPD